jgi:hypothetical protein
MCDGQVGAPLEEARTGPVLQFSPAEWEAFLGGARDGEFGSLDALVRGGLSSVCL